MKINQLTTAPFFANERHANDAEEFSVPVMVANEYVAGDEKGAWVQLSPFGKFPNKQGMQVFNASDAQNICNEFGSVAGKIANPFGLPVYVGHPDHPAFKDFYKDTSAKGRIKELANRNDSNCADCAGFVNETSESPCRKHGLFGRIKWNEDGKKLIANEEYHGHSTNWQMHREADGFHPHYLKSLGLTNEPGIPVPAITTANQKQNMDKAPKSFIEAVNGCLGTNYANEDDATTGLTAYANEHKATKSALGKLQGDHDALTKTHGDLVGQMSDITKKFGANEAIDTAVGPLFTNASRPAENLVPFLANELTTAREGVLKFGDATAATKVLTDAGLTAPEKDLLVFAANEASTARKALTTARTKVGEVFTKLLIAGGFLSKADAEKLTPDFVNEAKFDSTVTGLGSLKPKYRVTSLLAPTLPEENTKLRNIAEDKAGNVNKMVEMVNQRVEENKTKKLKIPNGTTAYDFAFKQIANENPELVAKMQKPEDAALPKQ